MFEDISKVLLITDMDGTFLPASKIPGKKTLDAVNRFQQAGGSFSIATGRSLQASQQYFDTVSVNCPIIMCNGGMIYDINSKEQIYDVYVPRGTRNIVKQILADNDYVGCEVLRLDNVYVPQLTPLEEKHIRICKVENPVLCGVDDIPDDWYKVLFAVEPKDMQRLIDYVQSQGFDGVDFVISAPEYYEILPQNISKGYALKMMREVCDMQDFTFVSVGDYNNDIEMIQQADIGFCPSNASPDVKAAADIILEQSCEQDAVAAVVEYIFNKTNNK
jgi:Cof subfamily protein (haloacid dehalogenase superfamily)